MDILMDEIVEVRVASAAPSAQPTSVNTVAVVGSAKSNTDVVDTYTTQASIEKAYGAESAMAGVTRSFFLEESNPGKIVCIPTDEDALPSADNIAELLDAALTEDFYNVIVRVEGSGVAADDIKNLVDVLDEWCIANFRAGYVEISDRAIAFATAELLKGDNSPRRVSVWFHSGAKKYSLAAAILAERCSKDPARGTFAMKTLTTVSADSFTREEFETADEDGLNIYCKIAGVNRTYFGSIGVPTTGKTFIDTVIKKDWLKFRTQEAIFNALGQANDGDGVDYNDAGIIAIGAAINSVFTTAANNEHRYILPDSFEVELPKYADISSADKKNRVLNGIRVPFQIQESIHKVKDCVLQIVE